MPASATPLDVQKKLFPHDGATSSNHANLTFVYRPMGTRGGNHKLDESVLLNLREKLEEHKENDETSIVIVDDFASTLKEHRIQLQCAVRGVFWFIPVR